MTMMDKWVTRADAAAFLTQMGHPISKRTLANLAANNNAGYGPPFKRLRKNVWYSLAALTQWLESEVIHIS